MSMRALIDGRRSIRPVAISLWSRLGSCPFCTRSAFRAALIAWVLTGLSHALPISIQFSHLTTIAACALTALWLGHLLGHAFRVSSATRSLSGTVRSQGAMSRRDIFKIFVRALATAAATTSLPSLALAECDQGAAERCRSAVSNCRAHCARVFHRDEAMHACHQECTSNYDVCITEAKCM
jgi:hypothetical protein